MKENLKARVIEIRLDKYILLTDEEIYIESIVRGNIKKKKGIIVGDNVLVEKAYDKYAIVKVEPRKNMLIRPPVANIDKLIIVISLDSPFPDYTLLDKQIILCKSKGIKPILCVNKIDLSNTNEILKKELKYITNTYTNLVDDIVYVSVVDNIGINELMFKIMESTSAFSGNSGVGKSSITKEVLKNLQLSQNGKDYIESIDVGDIASKTNKGKHTTKYVKLYNLSKDTFLLDTPGFSSYELYDIEYKELKNYYEEFIDCKCDYEDCSHVNESEKVCGVKKKLAQGLVDTGRYNRYVYMYTRLKELDDKKYK